MSAAVTLPKGSIETILRAARSAAAVRQPSSDDCCAKAVILDSELARLIDVVERHLSAVLISWKPAELTQNDGEEARRTSKNVSSTPFVHLERRLYGR